MTSEQQQISSILVPALVGLLVVVLATILLFLVAHNSELPKIELILLWIGRSVGAYLAVYFAVVMFIRTLQGTPPVEIVPATIPFLAGIALFHLSWAAALGLAIVATGYLIHSRLASSKPPQV